VIYHGRLDMGCPFSWLLTGSTRYKLVFVMERH
jgi:hypothetical protein